MKVYYEDQKNWKTENFYYLNRYLNRLFLYYEKDYYRKEIEQLDIEKMSIKTKTIIRCILEFQKKEYFMDIYPNLKELINIGPLEEPLYLEKPPGFYHEIYTKYNILW